MKSVALLASAVIASMGVLALAAPVSVSQPVKYMEISFGCNQSQPDLSQYAINFQFQSGEQRWQNPDARLQVNGSKLELVDVASDRRVVIGVVTSVPTCDTTDSSYTQASWNAVQLNPQVQVTAALIPHPETCQILLHSGYAYGRQEEHQIRIDSSSLQQAQTFSWVTQKTFATLEECEGKN